MDLLKAIQERHSVRTYLDEKIPEDIIDKINQKISEINAVSGLDFKLVTEEPKAFSGKLAHYGSFHNVTNYILLRGPKTKMLEEALGYYGEELVLYCQQLGLNSCWVGLTYSKKGIESPKKGDKMFGVIALGYGATGGKVRPSKKPEKVSDIPEGEMPSWFRSGVIAALLAPTAVNQQKFHFTLLPDGRVEAKAGFGPFTKMDLGIAKKHFEIGAGKDSFTWAN